MRKLSGLVVALLAIGALGAVATAAPKKKVKRVNTRVALNYKPGGGPYDPGKVDRFTGKVRSRGKCKRGRVVVVTGRAVRVGRARTSRNGRFSIRAPGIRPGTYRATVKRKVIRRRKAKGKRKGAVRRIVCKPARSKRVVVPAG